MNDAYCLTAREAAEMANVDYSEMMAMIAANKNIAIKAGGNWRVNPEAMSMAIARRELPRAA